MNRPRWAAWLVAIGLAFSILAAEEPSPPADVAAALQQVRADLLEARLDRALAGLDVLLARTDLDAGSRLEALALRAQARGATGDLDGVEEDYRRILALDPGFEPDPAATSKRAMERFRKTQSALVGTLEVFVDPPDAKVTVDGREVVVGLEGRLRVQAGSRVVRIERRGFDPAELVLEVPPGGSVPMRAELVPNARTLVLRTEPEGVEVSIDDVPAGTTARPVDPDPVVRATRPAELVLEGVPAGEHLLTLSRPCYRTARLREVVAVDVLDRSPKVVGPVVLQAARTVLVLEGAPRVGEILVDGERLADLPAAGPLEVCAGSRRIAIRSGGRAVWSETVEVPTGESLTLDVGPRPNVVLVGATRWPPSLAALDDAWSTVAHLEIPSGVDLTEKEGWSRIVLPPDADLAVAVLPQGGAAAADRFVLHSPALGTVSRFESPPDPSRPRWTVPDLGVRVVEHPGGGLIVSEARAGSPAAPASIVAGDRIAKVGGVDVGDLAAWVRAIGALAPGTRAELEIVGPDGSRRSTTATVAEGFRAGLLPEDEVARAIHAAWAAAVGAGGRPDAPAAWLDLAVALEREGRLAGAIDALRRSVWPARSGIGAGTVDYLAGRVLEAMGRDGEARAALGRAAATDARFFEDDGPEVGPAASDRLADLGVAR